MVILQSLALAALIIVLGHNQIRKHAAVSYIIATIISLAVIAAVWSGAASHLPAWAEYIVPIFTQGGLAGGLFAAVMYAAAVPNGSKFMRTVMPIRGELSIIACILTLGHNIAFGRTYFAALFTGSPLRWNYLAAAICSLIMLCIMLPLFITSFKCVRRKMKPRSWKRLQRFAYGFYALMYLHILFLNLPSARTGNLGGQLSVILYSILFLTYGCMRVGKALSKAKKPVLLRRLTPAVSILLMVCVCAGIWVPARTSQAAAPTSGYADGKYTGAGIGYNGRLTVSVTIEEGQISDIQVTSQVEDEEYYDDAVRKVIPAIIETQSTDVDVCSGATSTSYGLIDAVSAALNSASEED